MLHPVTGEPLDTDVDSMLDEEGNPIEGEM